MARHSIESIPLMKKSPKIVNVTFPGQRRVLPASITLLMIISFLISRFYRIRIFWLKITI